MTTCRPNRGPLRLCLAASGGGHLRQLLDLSEVWSKHHYFIATEDSALSQSLIGGHRTYFVSHFAWGQAKMGSPVRMLFSAIRNFFQSARIILRERPNFVLTTGAGAVFFTILWARLFGAQIFFIETFARFDRPSLFGKIVAPLAHYKVVQSPDLARYISGAKVFDPLRILSEARPQKKNLLFVTVGATLPFNRLVNSVVRLKQAGLIAEEVIIQTGSGGLVPSDIETHENLPFAAIQSYLVDADIVVCHGGTGSLITALRSGCRVVVMPRLHELGEHYDNHQAEIAKAFAARGLVTCANSEDDLLSALDRARAREAIIATSDPKELAIYLSTILDRLDG